MALAFPSPPRVGTVSLGCPKNLVDSERILTKLRSDGYEMSQDYAGADVVLVAPEGTIAQRLLTICALDHVESLDQAD